MRRVAALLAVVSFMMASGAPAQAYSSKWLHEAHCIHWHEAVSSATPTERDLTRGWRIHWHLKYYYGTHTPSPFRGGYQIAISTWQHFVPHGWPSTPDRASRAQQTLVAWRIYVYNGHSWGDNGQWPQTAKACGVH